MSQTCNRQKKKTEFLTESNWRTKIQNAKMKNTTNEDQVLCSTKEVSILFRSYAFHNWMRVWSVDFPVERCMCLVFHCFFCFVVFFRSFVHCVAIATSCKGIHACVARCAGHWIFYTIKCSVTIFLFIQIFPSQWLLRGFDWKKNEKNKYCFFWILEMFLLNATQFAHSFFLIYKI